MDATVLGYKCPCCGAGLVFGEESQKFQCEYCDNRFDLETIQAVQESERESQEQVSWQEEEPTQWSPEEQSSIQMFTCPSCAGELLTDEHTAATFCPYCGNPTILPGRLSDTWKPQGVIPFQTTREDAKAAFLKLCQGKPLLPRCFMEHAHVEKITGIYVPFWLYDCGGEFQGSYKATRIRTWSDATYNYTKTDHFLLRRGARAAFSGIPMDGSSKMEDSFMESIEPFDYGQMVNFDAAYLSGFLADKYDVPAQQGEERIRSRVSASMGELLQSSFLGYTSVVPTSRNLQVSDSRARYVLLPVWLLNTRYGDKTYTFAMNGQTGTITGAFPICKKRAAGWFAGIFAVVTALAAAVQLLI